jgi:hypothetical protein
MPRWLILVVFVACGGSQPGTRPTNRSSSPPPAPAVKTMASAWIEKLDDPRQRDRALQELEQLGDPAAIGPLGKVWLADRDLRALQVMISIARPLTADEAKARFVTDYEQAGRKASWDAAFPFLAAALRDIDPRTPRSVDAAVKAAEALGEARLHVAVEPLLALAARPVSKQTVTAQDAAIRALGKHAGDKAAIGVGLGRLIDVDPPRHPRTATTRDEARELETQFTLHLARSGSAINALGELRVATEIRGLLLALFRTPELAMQIRRTLVAIGPLARDAVLDMLAGKYAAVEQLIESRKLAKYCGDKHELPDTHCLPVAMRDYYAALVLGDLRDPRATPALLDALKRPVAPAYYLDDQPGPTQHTAILDALRKLGSAEAAAPLLALWSDPRAELGTRIAAIEAYGFVARDGAGSQKLATIAADNNADDNLRIAAAGTLARISTDQKDIGVFLSLASKYLDASAKRRAEADKQKPVADAAERPLARARQEHDAAKQALADATKDPSADATRIRTLTDAAKRAEDNLKLAKRKHREVTAPFRQAEQAAKAYIGFARMFQTHVARIAVVLRCRTDASCHAASLESVPDRAADQLTRYLVDVRSWTRDEKAGLVEASIERSMIELGKLGVAADAYSGALLDAAKSDNRIIRQSILLALPKITKVPCASCVEKLDAAIKAGEGKTALGDLNYETELVRQYFARTGGGAP